MEHRHSPFNMLPSHRELSGTHHCTGETVPASDSDEEARGESALEGPLREREEYVAQAIARRHGISSTVRPL